jgi:hypothetical protein
MKLPVINDIQLKLKQEFGRILFTEDTHSYVLDDESLPSVSHKLKSFYKPFDSNIAKFVAGKGKYKEMNAYEVKQSWKQKAQEAAEFGTKIHLFGEKYVTDCIKPSNNFELGIVQWWMDLPSFVIPISLEQIVFSEKYSYAGTGDILLLNLRTGGIIIADYKTNEDLFKNYNNQKMYEPFDDLLDNAFNKYQLQLSHYQLALEEKGFIVESRVIIWLTENKEKNKYYRQYQTEDYTLELKKYYGNNS